MEEKCVNGKKPILNNVKNRLLILSPIVMNVLEKEYSVNDFFFEGGKPIGKGGFGEVWKIVSKSNKKQFVVKIINKNNIIKKKLINQLNRELEINYMVNHPHIVKLLNHFEDDDNFYLIMNYASKGQLFTQLKRRGRLDEKTTAQCLIELISALKYFHSFNPPIIHRDIKPENILLDENFRVKLSDFGWSNYYSEDEIRKTYCGTPDYLAPEMLKKSGHGTSMDIWSLGVLIFELLSGSPPFSGKDQQELFSNIRNHKLNWPSDFPPLAKNLISLILKENPSERISLDQIVTHKWFKSIDGLKPPDSLGKLINLNLENSLENLSNTDKFHRIMDRKKSILQDEQEIKKKTQSLNTDKDKLIDNNILKDNEFKKIIKLTKEKYENEVKALYQELNRLHEVDETNRFLTKENFKLKEEVEKYKIMDLNRLEILGELELKNNEKVELKNKITKQNNEASNILKLNKVFEKDINNLKLKIDNLENEKEDLIKKIEELSNDNIENTTFYQKKIEILQVKILEEEYKEIGSDEIINYSQFMDIINEEIKDISNQFYQKIKVATENLKQTEEFIGKSEEIICRMMVDKKTIIENLINQLKTNFESDVETVKKVISDEKNYKTNERLEYLKKQITELLPYKMKCIHLEAKIEKLDNNVIILEKKISNLKDIDLLRETFLKETEKKLSEMKIYVNNLEAKLSDIKDFLFKNCNEKLDEFYRFYNNY